MKILIKHVHHVPSSAIIELIRSELESIKEVLQITEARVLLHRRHEASPPCRVAFHLVAPGPDIFAEAEDHTLRAALNKAVGAIRAALAHRDRKRRRSKKESATNASPRRAAGSGKAR